MHGQSVELVVGTDTEALILSKKDGLANWAGLGLERSLFTPWLVCPWVRFVCPVPRVPRYKMGRIFPDLMGERGLQGLQEAWRPPLDSLE